MNKENMAQMSVKELNEYAKLLNIKTNGADTVDALISLIERRRERCAKIEVLGLALEIPIKKMRDKRITDVLTNTQASDEELADTMRLILGDEQFKEVLNACTEEDGTVDVDALALCFSKIYTSKKLKNF